MPHDLKSMFRNVLSLQNNRLEWKENNYCENVMLQHFRFWMKKRRTWLLCKWSRFYPTVLCVSTSRAHFSLDLLSSKRMLLCLWIEWPKMETKEMFVRLKPRKNCREICIQNGKSSRKFLQTCNMQAVRLSINGWCPRVIRLITGLFIILFISTEHTVGAF